LDLLDQEIVLLSDELLQGADYSFLDESSIGVVGLSGASPLAASLTDLTDMQLEGGGQRLLTLDGLKELLGPSVQETLLTQQIVLMEQEVRELRAEIAHFQSVKNDLEQVRDLAWHTYTTLSTKVAELALASQSAESEIRFTVESVPPRKPEESRHPMTTVALAGAVGLMLAVGMAFLLDFMDQEPVIIGWWKARSSPGQ
jgi:hypothetical protein